MEFAIYPLAILGFIFGISAYTQIKSLKETVTKLEKEIEDIKG